MTRVTFDTNKATNTYVDFRNRIGAEATVSGGVEDLPRIRFLFESECGVSLGLD